MDKIYYKELIEKAAILHDIGKIGIPTELLKKEGNLTEEEAAVMKKHTKIGAKFLEDIYAGNEKNDFIRISTDIIKYHHEHYDGNGYPYGKKGEEIPLGSRIISIADAYDSMVSNRAYRQGLQSEEALKLIEEKAGVQFDPELISVFKSILPAAAEEIKDFETKMKFHLENEEQALGH